MLRPRWASAAAILIMLGPASVWADTPMGTPSNALPVDTVSSGGGLSASGVGAGNHLSSSTVAEPIASLPMRTTNNLLMIGGMNIYFFPGTITTLQARSDITNSSVTLQWSTPGYDGENSGTLQGGSSYYLVIASYTAPNLFKYSETNPPPPGAFIATGTVGTSLGTQIDYPATSLVANTTYYMGIFLADNQGDYGYMYQSTFTTLANKTVALTNTFVDVFYTSTTLGWAALLPALAGETSTMTGEGFELDASSTNFGALSPGGVIYTSVTYNNAASTLTVDGAGQPMSFGNTTYYFRVGSLNWAGMPNYIALQKLNLQISMSTIGVSFGTFNPVLGSTVSISSAQVVNLGNVPVTLQVAGKMATSGGSPWTLGTSAGVDMPLLQGLWNNATPNAANPGWTSITLSTLTSSGVPGGAYYTGAGLGQNAYEIQPGSSSTMWFKFTPPTSTSSVAKELMAIQFTPIYP